MDLEKLLRTDFSSEARHKQETLSGLLETIENGSQVQQHERMYKVMKKRKTAGILAACLVVLLSITALAFGGDIFRIVKQVTVGDHAKFNVIEVMEQNRLIPIPAELAGKLFDENGTVLTVYPNDNSTMYTESGEKVEKIDYMVWTDENGDHEEYTIVTEANAQQIEDEMFTIAASKEDARQYTMFDFKTPAYIPEGYNQITYKMFNDENGQPVLDSKYLTVEYVNADGDMIYCQLRYMDEETAFEGSMGDDVDKMYINGYEAAVSKSDISVEIDGIMYMFINNTIGRDELIKIASSIQ